MDAELARSIWAYNPETGHFYWLVSPRYRIEVGDRAGFFNGKYWILRWRGKNYKAARVAWLMQTGAWPVGQIDHKNCDKLDDSFLNLREASNEQNCCNRRTRKDNVLGIKGVHEQDGRFIAQIGHKRRVIYLGCYGTPIEAKRAYDAQAAVLHGEFSRR